MSAGQPLRGLVGQGMGGPKARPPQVEPFTFPGGGTYSFNPPYSGKWKFVGWGAGGIGGGGVNAASGSYVEVSRFLNPGQIVTIVTGRQGAPDTTITFSDGKVVTAGGAVTTTPGAAVGGDVNLNGSAATASGLGSGGGISTTGQGAGAPAKLPYRGADGTTGQGLSPGGGGGQSPTTSVGGEGFVIAVLR